jgi:hypothetical protein
VVIAERQTSSAGHMEFGHTTHHFPPVRRSRYLEAQIQQCNLQQQPVFQGQNVELNCTWQRERDHYFNQGTTLPRQINLDPWYPSGASKSQLHRVHDDRLVQGNVFKDGNSSLGHELERVPAPHRNGSCTKQMTIQRRSLRSNIPPLVGYELWRIEKGGGGWAHATQKKVVASQSELAQMASTSSNLEALAYMKWMGLDCLMQLNKIFVIKSIEQDGDWQLAWAEMVRFNTGRNNQTDVRTFDVIIARTRLGDPTHISSHVSGEKSSTGREMVLFETITERPLDSSAKASVSRSRLSPLGQRFVQISTDQYDECLRFLLLNPAAVDEDHLQYLTEARLALDRGDEQLARSCLGKQVFVRDCKDERPQKYFDMLMKNQEGRRVFNNDLDNALARLKQVSRQDLGGKQQIAVWFDIKTPYKKGPGNDKVFSSLEKLSQHDVEGKQESEGPSDSIEMYNKSLSHENKWIKEITEDLREAKAEVRRKKKELDSVLADARHQDWKVRREKNKFEEVREERMREEARLRRQERKRDEAREKCMRPRQERRQPCAKIRAGASAPKDSAHAHEDIIDPMTEEKGKSQDIRCASRSDIDGPLQKSEKYPLQSLEAEQPRPLELLDRLPYPQDTVECSDTDRLNTLDSYKSPRQEDDKPLVKECLAAPTEIHVDAVKAVHKARDTRVWNKKHGEDCAIKLPEEHTTPRQSSAVTVKANISRQVGVKGVATVLSAQKTSCIENINLALQERATKTTTDASPTPILPRYDASHSRARASSWPSSPIDRSATGAVEEDIHTDIECPEPEFQEENDLNNMETETPSTELEDILAEEIEGYHIQQRELKTAEEKVRAREDEVAIEKSKIEEVKEQQRQMAVQLHEHREAFTKAQQVQCQIFEEYQRNAKTLVDRMQAALARIEEKEHQQLVPHPQPSQFEVMGETCGFGVNYSRCLFWRLCTWHKHRHALLP